MPNFTDYEITVETTVLVVCLESGKEVVQESYSVTDTGKATTSNFNNTPLRPAIAATVSRAAEKTVAHANAVQENENKRRGLVL